VSLLPPFQPVATGDLRIDRLQDYLAQYLQQLDGQVGALVSPSVLPATRDAQITSETFVDYRGPGGHTISLPFADSAGPGRGRLVHIVNNGNGSVAVAARGKDSVNGSKLIFLEAGSYFIGAANGERAWSSVRTQVAPTISTEWYSPVQSAVFFFGQSAGNVTASAGNFTVGDKFSSTRPLVCNGIRFFWKDAGASKTVRCRLYGGSTSLASKDVSVSASGVYEGLFTTPITLSGYLDYAATIWETGGGFFPRIDASGGAPFGAEPIVGMIPTGPFTIARSFKRNAAGDAVPVNTSATSFYPVEPIFAPFSLE
jgi:hypothetical protein